MERRLSHVFQPLLRFFAPEKRVMGLEPTISCLGSKRSTTELHPLDARYYKSRISDEQLIDQLNQRCARFTFRLCIFKSSNCLIC